MTKPTENQPEKETTISRSKRMKSTPVSACCLYSLSHRFNR